MAAQLLWGMIYMSNDAAKIYRAGVITASDKGSQGLREDVSGSVIKEILEANGYSIASYCVLPDDLDLLSGEMKRLSDNDLCDVIFTTGGTGFSPRDITPEATLLAADRLVPGISEAMRFYSMTITKRAMLSRGICAIRARTLIVNLPGSPKAVRESLEYIIGELGHGLAVLRSDANECAR